MLSTALLSLAAIAYGVLLGDNWHWYAMALMLAAIRAHRRRALGAERSAAGLRRGP